MLLWILRLLFLLKVFISSRAKYGFNIEYELHVCDSAKAMPFHVHQDPYRLHSL